MRPLRGEGGVPPRRAVGYVRVSTEGQADRGVSLDAQAEKIRAMATVHDVELVDVIVDGGESGKSLSRPGIDQALGMVDRREVQVVIIAKLDRLTRSVRDLGELLERFHKKGVALVSVGKSLDTGSATGRLVLNVMASVSQWEREAIGERTRDALRHKRALGLRAGNVPFGYSVAEDGQTLVPCEGEQQVLMNLRALRAAPLPSGGCLRAECARDADAVGNPLAARIRRQGPPQLGAPVIRLVGRIAGLRYRAGCHRIAPRNLEVARWRSTETTAADEYGCSRIEPHADMKPGISEFSYGYAITEELLNQHLKMLPRVGAPQLPSLIAESTRGYDLKIRFVHSLLFLQFKLSDCMIGDRAVECRKQGVSPPFHRFYIHGKEQSAQHQLLLQLEVVPSSVPRLVRYVAPQFHKAAELDKFYGRKQVASRSVFVSPTLIGAFTDSRSHSVAFPHPTGPLYINSEPRIIDRPVGIDTLRHQLSRENAKGAVRVDSVEIAEVAVDLNRLIQVEGLEPGIEPDSSLGREQPLALVGHLARNYFGCETVVVGTTELDPV